MANEQKTHLEKGEQFYDEGKYDKACEEYTAAEKDKPLKPETYYHWGVALYSLRNYDKSIEKISKVLNENKTDIKALNALALNYGKLKKYDAAESTYRQSINLYPDAVYFHHNLANLMWRQGRYEEGREEWLICEQKYSKEIAEGKIGARDCQYYGEILHEIFGELKEAEELFKKGLEVAKKEKDEIQTGIILADLVSLYLEMGNEDFEKEGNIYFWKAREKYEEAISIFQTLRKNDEADAAKKEKFLQYYLQLSKLYLSMEEYDKAKDLLDEVLKNIYETNQHEPADLFFNLGLAYLGKEDFKKSVQYFSTALKIDSDNLTLQRNLAESFRKVEAFEKAEKEYRKILKIAPTQVEAHIGLGEVDLALAEKGQTTLYKEAIAHFDKAFRIVNEQIGSKRLKKNEFAILYYQRGYAKVKQYESEKNILFKNPLLLLDAKKDFAACSSDFYKAEVAIEKINARLVADISLPGLAPTVGFIFAIFLFLTTQCLFFSHATYLDENFSQKLILDFNSYNLMTFSSLGFMIISAFMPKILTLKIGNVELTKSTTDQIASSFGIESISTM